QPARRGRLTHPGLPRETTATTVSYTTPRDTISLSHLKIVQNE
ncbi:hypothetical protein GGD83_004971, partial [Rhodoblastus sphagnicola]|nr:hypothetical protein [Rhodoblastus sphagnicola]